MGGRKFNLSNCTKGLTETTGSKTTSKCSWFKVWIRRARHFIGPHEEMAVLLLVPKGCKVIILIKVRPHCAKDNKEMGRYKYQGYTRIESYKRIPFLYSLLLTLLVLPTQNILFCTGI